MAGHLEYIEYRYKGVYAQAAERPACATLFDRRRQQQKNVITPVE